MSWSISWLKLAEKVVRRQIMRNLNQNTILEIYGRLEIGRTFFSSLRSILGFLRRGHMRALLKTSGNKPDLKDELMSAVMAEDCILESKYELMTREPQQNCKKAFYYVFLH